MQKNNARAEPPDRMSADLADEIGGLLIAYLRGEAPRTSNLLGFDNYLQPEAEDFEGNKRTFSFTNLDEFYNFIDDFKEFIRNDVSIREFVARKSYIDQERSRRLRESVALTASDRFLRFLEKKGLPEEEAQRFGKLHQEFLQENLPEVEVLSAVQELRDQFHSGPPVEQKRPYPGKR